MRKACTREDPYKWGGFLEILAATILYETPIHVHVMDIRPEYKICYEESYLSKNPIRLSFKGGDHYNALVADVTRNLKSHPGEVETLRLSDVSNDNISQCKKFVSMDLSNKELTTILNEKGRSTVFKNYGVLS